MFRHLAFPLALSVCACTSFADRYAVGNAALSSDEGAMYFVVMSPKLQLALNACIPPGTKDASPTLVIVADVSSAGVPENIDIEPDSPGTACVERRLAAGLPRPPRDKFPIGLRVDTR